MNILVGISGGVDSAVALNLLKSQGHDVISAMMKIYDGEIKTIANSCYGTDKLKEIEDAKAISKLAGCEFNLIDLSKEYDSIIFQEFKKQYLKGLTPNPCVNCNQLIKFGMFLKVAKEKGIIFDKFATGHYARNEFNEKTGRYELKKGKNPKKDQTYFLYGLSQNQLKDILFPLGLLDKTEVRKMALEFNIPVAKKQDSQDFYKGDYNELFEIKNSKGEIRDSKGNILGYHNGIFNYTIGQRKGLKIAYSKPLYVIDIIENENLVIVGIKDETFKKTLIANNINWVALNNPIEPFEAKAKIRSSQEPVDVVVYPESDKIKVEFKEKISAIANGQSVVLYDDDIVLGGGIIINSY